MIILYDQPLSPYAQKVKIALREKGVAFETEIPRDLGFDVGASAFAVANPRSEVPVLTDGETEIFDSTIILDYLEDRWPAPPLLPSDPAARAEARMIEEVMDTHYEAINWGMAEIDWFGRASGEAATTLKAAAARQAAGLDAWLERRLGDQPWFDGVAFGRGDLSVVPHLVTAAGWGSRPAPGSRLAAWLERALGRASVAEGLAEARAVRTGAVDVADLVARGLFKRHYRDHRLEWMIKSGGLEVVAKGLETGTIRFTRDFG